ncbi:sensor histidine kinase [Nonlabens antarcticus]|uniref:sensor histidine kinase n=1 Tax=Nonlabens antarcticus TaxID=392714 RepID=UPI0018919DA0|nr:ATP-binding protein [Nonlabens antarcticus]
MKLYRNSLRNRIFFSMILLTLISSVLIAGMSIYQYTEQGKDYHNKRLQRKEEAILESLRYTLEKTDWSNTTDNLPFIFDPVISEISDVHKMPVIIYDLRGHLIKTSDRNFVSGDMKMQLDSLTLYNLRNADEGRYVYQFSEEGLTFRSSYTYLKDDRFKNIAIIHLPYLENDDFIDYELTEFLYRIGIVYILMFMFSILIAYLLSRYITKSIREISDKIKKLSISKRNQKIHVDVTGSEEINTLVESYNDMVDELEESAVKLATSEREQAWREMAKQVAHEIKNPLTPMRLTVQSFQRRFDPEDPEATAKLAEYSNSLIEQIDVMSNIAGAFSTYATMPAQKTEQTNVPKITQLALDIFIDSDIHYSEDSTDLCAIFDRTQLIRVVTNLVKNAMQAGHPDRESIIHVCVTHNENQIFLSVEDNGMGVHPDNEYKIFEPKFTTKNSGMGLGLAMVKQIVENFNGTISMKTVYGEGATFTVSLPRSK